MNFKSLLDAWNDLISWLNKEDVATITKLNNTITVLTTRNTFLTSSLKDSELLIGNYASEVEQLRKRLFVLRPVEVLKPSWLEEGIYYKPRRRFISKNYDYHITLEQPQDAFDKSVYLQRKMLEKGFLEKEKKFINLTKIHKWIVGQIHYENDLQDNWRTVTDTLISKRGDCDDSGGVALTSAFGMAGWTAEETFCCCGWYYPNNDGDINNRFYHSWNRTLINDEWYICEGTNRKGIPVKWEEVKEKYKEDCCFNWKFSGRIKNNKKYLG